ncbi:MAG: ribonuclease H-like domain-containing protein [Candidatus Delongbacteria bacterium]|nr:ribonuclease H-like domain-containing protein [Candidatus Delongbacteria bacterium]
MKCIVLDIETAGVPFEELSVSTREYLLRWNQTTAEQEETKKKTGLWAPFGEIVSIALFKPDDSAPRTAAGELAGEATIIYNDSSGSIPALPSPYPGVRLREPIGGSEQVMLETFWKGIAAYDRIITFNGRGFDAPFLLQRSVIHGVKASRDLMPSRFYGLKSHFDLLEVLTFFSASRRFNLETWAEAVGAINPKDEGITGAEVAAYWREGRIAEIAAYNLRDVLATWQLYRRVNFTMPWLTGSG